MTHTCVFVEIAEIPEDKSSGFGSNNDKESGVELTPVKHDPSFFVGASPSDNGGYQAVSKDDESSGDNQV